MLYEYYCEKCGKEWEESLSIADRDQPCKNQCKCAAGHGSVKRGISAPGLCFEGSVGKISKTGNFKNND